jgi:uncharacterized RDD family membrane protein YckC
MNQLTYNAHETQRMQAIHGYELASFRLRAEAFLVDLFVGAILFLVVAITVVLLGGGRVTSHISGLRFGPAPGPGVVDIRLTFFKNWYGVVWWVVYFGLTTYIGNGRTIGKRLLHIRVVSLVHERISLWHCIERALGYGASALEFGFGFMQYFVHPNRRTVHDRIAETIVVLDDQDKRCLEQAPAEPADAALLSPKPAG